MRYKEFEIIMSVPRMSRYLSACNNNSRKAMTLYRLNLRLSQELFTVISCFEISLRNSINSLYLSQHGNDWLRNSIRQNGFFNSTSCRLSKKAISDSKNKLGRAYSHNKLVAELGFGFWRYMFAAHQFRAGGQSLLHIFPNRPSSTPVQQYNSAYVFNQLKKVNTLRNRLAHHEPICFESGQSIIYTGFASQHYQLILEMFRWLGFDERGLLYGLDHVDNVIQDINNL